MMIWRILVSAGIAYKKRESIVVMTTVNNNAKKFDGLELQEECVMSLFQQQPTHGYYKD